MLEALASQLLAVSPLEAVAVVLAVLYLLLAIRQSIWCWPFAFLYTAIYVYLFVAAKLYMESVLHLFYCGMAVYGWYVWYAGRSDADELPVVSWSVGRHTAAIAAVAGIALCNGLLMASLTDAAYPIVDSATTWYAIWATYLVARKVLENWWYWLVIDAVSIVIYWSRDLQLTALLYVLYVALIPFGILAWRRSWKLGDQERV